MLFRFCTQRKKENKPPPPQKKKKNHKKTIPRFIKGIVSITRWKHLLKSQKSSKEGERIVWQSFFAGQEPELPVRGWKGRAVRGGMLSALRSLQQVPGRPCRARRISCLPSKQLWFVCWAPHRWLPTEGDLARHNSLLLPTGPVQLTHKGPMMGTQEFCCSSSPSSSMSLSPRTCLLACKVDLHRDNTFW